MAQLDLADPLPRDLKREADLPGHLSGPFGLAFFRICTVKKEPIRCCESPPAKVESRFSKWWPARQALRVKIKSLAEEARIIRQEEQRLDGQDFRRGGLRGHRIRDVRQEARAAQVAYAYLRRKSYQATEHAAKSAPNLARVREIVRKFGSREHSEAALTAWLSE